VFGNFAHIFFGHSEDLRGNNMDVVSRLKEFMENEARSCSMDFGCVTPQYVYRMWGGVVTLDKIEAALIELKRQSLLA